MQNWSKRSVRRGVAPPHTHTQRTFTHVHTGREQDILLPKHITAQTQSQDLADFRSQAEKCYTESATKACKGIPYLESGNLKTFIETLFKTRPPARVEDNVLDLLEQTFLRLAKLDDRPATDEGFKGYLRLPNESKWNVCWMNAFVQGIIASGLGNEESTYTPWQACINLYKNLATIEGTNIQSAGLCVLLYRMALLSQYQTEHNLRRLRDSAAFSWRWHEIGGDEGMADHILSSYTATTPSKSKVYFVCPAGHDNTRTVEDRLPLAITDTRDREISLQEVQVLRFVCFVSSVPPSTVPSLIRVTCC